MLEAAVVIPVSVSQVAWQKLEAKKLFYIDRMCWEFLFGEGAERKKLNASQIWDVVKEARRTIRGKKGVDDLGQNVVSEIRDFRPVTFDKVRTFLRLTSHHYDTAWEPEEHIHKCVFWMPGLRDALDASTTSVKGLSTKLRISQAAIQSLVECYRGPIEVCRAIAEVVFEGDPDEHISTEIPDKPRSPEPNQGKMDIKKNPVYVYSQADFDAKPNKAAPWLEL